MKTKAARKPFNDPFDGLSDEQFEREVLESLDQATTKSLYGFPKTCLAGPSTRRKDAGSRISH